MRVAIMQPTYLSWVGYFALIGCVDTFVFYDDVQFVKQSWQQRNRIKAPQTWIYLSVPVIKHFGQKINAVKINNNIDWRDRHWQVISQYYKKASSFEMYADGFKVLYEKEWEYLIDLNVTIIKRIASMLGLDTKFMLSSELHGIGTKTDRVISILNELGATEYLTVPGTKGYLEPYKFKANGIKLFRYEFNHPTYPQLYGDFIPYLSVIDLLFNVGHEAASIVGGNNSLTLVQIL